MKFYLVFETTNGKENAFLKGAYLTKEEATENCHPIGKAYHSALIDGKYHMVPDTYEYSVEERELDSPTFDIYIDTIRDGRRIENLTFGKAKELFDKYSETNWVQLQLPLAQFGGIAVTKILSNEDENYWEQRKAYWDAREQEEKENEFYSPSCPWNAPGMSTGDFI